jgi:hypothetical protein
LPRGFESPQGIFDRHASIRFELRRCALLESLERQQIRCRRGLALGRVTCRDNRREELVERGGLEDVENLVTKRSGRNRDWNLRGGCADERRSAGKKNFAARDERLQLYSFPRDELGNVTR